MTQPIVEITVDGRRISTAVGQNVLVVCIDHKINVPNLCYDKKLSVTGDCGLCLGSINGKAPVKLCEATVVEGMNIITDNDTIRKLRKNALEKLIVRHRGDCIAPCKKACPAGSDCQGYASLIAEGRFYEAWRLLLESYPLPASLGRVCPHPCEDACRRGLIDEPISLALLKRVAVDYNLKENKKYLLSCAAPTGKRVAIIGGGPAGLTAAWFLAQAGHKVLILEAKPEAGGMFRYGIPEFRLPKDVLGQEIAALLELGVEIRTNTTVGADVQLSDLLAEYDAVLIAIGAWKNVKLNIEGENADGVLGGIEFLTRFALDGFHSLGRRVAVIGGGNTAIDACRTAIRLPDVDEVHLIYRRSREEMPAFAQEVCEAEQEGVQFHFLFSPAEIEAVAGQIDLKLQKMRLCEPDETNRRRPVPIEGAFEYLRLDSVVSAVGQQAEIQGFELVERQRNGSILTDGGFSTSVSGVFACGDAANDGPGIAVEAIGQGKEAARAIDAFIKGIKYQPESTNYVKQNDLTAEDYPEVEREDRAHEACLSTEERRKSFREISEGVAREEAIREAKRCLECGCLDLYECRLLQYAKEYGVDLSNASDNARKQIDTRHPYIFYDANKCIFCGQCVRVCDEIMGYRSWVMEGTEDATELKTSTGGPLQSTYCIGCGQCVEHCPTGALTERNPRLKPLVVEPEIRESVCNFCGVGCSTMVYSYGDAPIKVTPRYGGSIEENLLCRHGRFGWHTVLSSRSLTEPMLKQNKDFTSVSWKEAYADSIDNLRKVQSRYGKDSVAVLIADRMTAEEIFLSRKFADALDTNSVYSANIYQGGMEEVFGLDGSTNSYRELADTDLIFILGADVPSYYAMLAVPVQQAVKKGAKLLLAAAEGWNGFNMLAHQRAVVEDDTRFLKEMIKALIDMGCKPENATGFEELSASLAAVNVSAEALDFAKSYQEASNAMIMLDRERVSAETARLLSALSVISGHIGKPKNGMIQMLQHNNTQCIALMGIQRKMAHLESDIDSGKIKGLVLAEQFIPNELAEKLEYVLLLDSMEGPAFSYSGAFLPMPGYGALEGTYISAEGRVQKLNRIFSAPAGKDGYEVLGELISQTTGEAVADLDQLRRKVAAQFPVFKEGLIDGKDFIRGEPVRYQRGYHFPDGKARLYPAQSQSPMFGDMVFADAPLVTWFGQLISEGMLKY